MGRFTVVSAVLVEALQRGWVSAQEVTAFVVHARAHHRVASTRRGEVAIAAVETPWRLVVEAFVGSGARSRGCRLGSLAWRMRGVVALVCVVQSVAEGRTWPGVLGAAVIALTYLVPAGARAVEARATAAGDAEVVAADLGGVLVEVLDRGGQRMSLERRQRLQASPSSGASAGNGTGACRPCSSSASGAQLTLSPVIRRRPGRADRALPSWSSARSRAPHRNAAGGSCTEALPGFVRRQPHAGCTPG